ncbi:MAG: hypothetical protein M3Q74_13205 [Pseudomonadota bacterium]|nr:hypothetical protein [Pseudomonadota bacterium]
MGGLLSRLFGHAPAADPDVEVHAAELAVLEERGRIDRDRARESIRAWERDESALRALRDGRGSGVADTLLRARDRGREGVAG